MSDIDAKIEEVDAAISKVLEAQEYQIGDRRILRARLKELQALKQQYEKEKTQQDIGTTAWAVFK